MNLSKKTLIVITGPTASGKSALAIDIAHCLGSQVISADSRQIYKDIPIATAQPTSHELAEVPHHLIGFLGLDSYYSASLFAEQGLELAKKLWETSDYAIVCGGSMMYVDALCNGIDNLPTIPSEIREALKTEVGQYGEDWLKQRLFSLDPVYYNQVDLNNTKRVFHAVEICLAAQQPYSSLRKGKRTVYPFKIKKFAISHSRDILFNRINSRVAEMMKLGLEEEARRVLPFRNFNSLNTVGIKEMFAYFDGVLDRQTAIARIGKNTRVYAKKQLTWLKKDKDINWIENTKDILKILKSSKLIFH